MFRCKLVLYFACFDKMLHFQLLGLYSYMYTVPGCTVFVDILSAVGEGRGLGP